MSDARKGSLLVTGATGRQGNAVLRHMVGRGWRLRALTRNPEGAAARALTRAGIEVVAGDLDDRASLERATLGMKAVFAVTDPWGNGIEREIAQAKRLADVSRDLGVSHFVYASVATADRKTGVPHFESKGEIERHIERLGLRSTFMRPAFFMDMLVPALERRAPLVWGALVRALGRRGRIQLIAVDDIGRAVSEALLHPEEHVGRAFELAGDELTMPEAEHLYRTAAHARPRIIPVPFWMMRLVDREAEINFRWIGDEGWDVDVAATHARWPWMHRFDTWLAEGTARGWRSWAAAEPSFDAAVPSAPVAT